MQATPEKLLTVQELARRLDVGQCKVRNLAHEGRIPSVQVGPNGMRFDWQEVLAALRTEQDAELKSMLTSDQWAAWEKVRAEQRASRGDRGNNMNQAPPPPPPPPPTG